MDTAAIVVIGNEVLSAKVEDLNGPWLAKELRGLGVELRRIETVPDEIPLIVDAITRARAIGRWVFTSGGIGPTHDDVTIAAVARAFGVEVVHDPHTLELLHARFGPVLKPALRRLAEIPRGCEVVWSEGHLFPVLLMERVVVLPGVPSMLREGFTRLRERFRGPPIHARAVYLSVGESALAEHLDATVAQFPRVGLGSYPRFDGADHKVKVTFDGRDEAEVQHAVRAFVARLPRGVVVREE
jgi:molybdenum cofactor synthesis domain-containing protein